MLTYKVKLNDNNFKQCELDWREKFLSPNLSIVTGVTESNYHLEKFKYIKAVNDIYPSNSVLNLDSHNVVRQGFIVASGKTYNVESGSVINYFPDYSGKTIDYKYVEINGKYFYWNEENNGYVIDNLLNYDQTSGILETVKVEASKDDETIKIDTVYWIEDGKVLIDGNEYFFDKEENGGSLKFHENGNALEYSSITECDGFDFHPYTSQNDYEEVTKFSLTKNENVVQNFDKITFCKSYYYIKYKDHYCQIIMSGNSDNYAFYCEIPKYVVSGGTVEDNLEPKYYEVYYSLDVGNDSVESAYREALENGQKLDKDHYDEHHVKQMDELKNTIPFVYVDYDDICISVERDVMNANDGSEIIVYLNDGFSSLDVGETIEFTNVSEDIYSSTVYNSKDYGVDLEEEFIFFNGKKYVIEKNLCDKLLINGDEYDIEYINGREEDTDCLVTINNEKVPMKIISLDDDGGGVVERYGYIVSSGNNVSSGITYDIKPYYGVIIDGERCLVNEYVNEETSVKFADIALKDKYSFTITNVLGNSAFICTPFVDTNNFTEDFKRYISSEVCRYVVSNQNMFELQSRNKLFGDSKITKDLAFGMSENPVSSSDYYDLFKHLRLFVNNGYVSLPLILSSQIGGNVLQDDIVKRDFFEAEKNRAINRIVDMEKDVYVPKIIVNGRYEYSNTLFENINRINLNLHFRTRNLNNWVVNDGLNDARYAADESNRSIDNWFVTDFHPYSDILGQSGDTLQSMSDLIGLLDFTYDDVFYQRQRISKSFVRLSFYDTTDQQTQSLLATSCVFMDSHKLYKRLIDNSRKNLFAYGTVSEPLYRTNESGYTIMPKEDITELHSYNKISVNSEFLGQINRNVFPIYSGDDVILDEERRISSRLTIEDKYRSNTSSEGFYLYMFREYSENLHPKPIYMKIEFNHAGIGRKIPFVIPMHWSGNTDVNADEYNIMYPHHFLRLSNEEDLEELLSGTPLSYLYAQMYIPLYAVYDFRNKEYGYVFDSRYVEVNENGEINLNLFELKVQNEDTTYENEQIDISHNMQRKANININTNQFDNEAFN